MKSSWFPLEIAEKKRPWWVDIYCCTSSTTSCFTSWHDLTTTFLSNPPLRLGVNFKVRSRKWRKQRGEWIFHEATRPAWPAGAKYSWEWIQRILLFFCVSSSHTWCHNSTKINFARQARLGLFCVSIFVCVTWFSFRWCDKNGYSGSATTISAQCQMR